MHVQEVEWEPRGSFTNKTPKSRFFWEISPIFSRYYNLRQFSLHCTKIPPEIGNWDLENKLSSLPSFPSCLNTFHTHTLTFPFGKWCILWACLLGKPQSLLHVRVTALGIPWATLTSTTDGTQVQRPPPSWTLGEERRQSLNVEKREMYWTYIMIIVRLPDLAKKKKSS